MSYIIEIETAYNSGVYQPTTVRPVEYPTRDEAESMLRIFRAAGSNIIARDRDGYRYRLGLRVTS